MKTLTTTVSHALLGLALAGLGVGCAAPAEEVGHDDDALSAAASNDWYVGTFDGSCRRTFSGAPASYGSRTLEVLFIDGNLVVREPVPVTNNGAVLAIDTTILWLPRIADGTFYEEQLDPDHPHYRQVMKGSCDAARCTIVGETKVRGERVEGGSFQLTRTAEGLVWATRFDGQDYYDLETGVMPESELYTETETCTLKRVP